MCMAHAKPWLAIKSAEQYTISKESTILSTFVFCRIAVQIATRGFVVNYYGGQNCRFGTSNDLTLKKGDRLLSVKRKLDRLSVLACSSNRECRHPLRVVQIIVIT
ncbi:hypothetical protein CEXT_469991 [Caerostris extrusa]|uniref:Uncharacterized protein n=1 Tax=Caerostris extrusa TaxID=172846 RepID=A0AAV4NR94_CAEEX|nr:hypothetical protein CEXT_469991 [Caerostris extrusa]